MAVPARLETVLEKLGVMTSEHFVNPAPEQAQSRCALLPCWQVRPPDGPLAPSLGRLPLGYQRREVIEVGLEFGDSVPLSLNVSAEGAQAPVKPLILVQLLRREVIQVGFEFGDSVPLSLYVPAEGLQAPVKLLILVELALLVPAEASQELGYLAYLPVESSQVASTAAESFLSFGQPPPDIGDLMG